MKSLSRWLMLLMMISMLGLFGCAGDDGKDGKNADPAELAALQGQVATLQAQVVALQAELALAADQATVDALTAEIADLNDQIAAVQEEIGNQIPSFGLNDTPVNQCAYCHQDAGQSHQAVYDSAFDSSVVATVTNVASVATATGYNSTIYFDVTKNGLPLTDLSSLDGSSTFQIMQYDPATSKFDNVVTLSKSNVVAGATAGSFSVTGATDYDATGADAAVFMYLTGGKILSGPPTQHITLYDNVANAGFSGAGVTYESAANVAGCEKCHGTPYGKHGYRQAEVSGLPDFAACKGCHYDSRPGGHEDWQYMIDNPYAWATGVAATENYTYTANVMNDVHMSHAAEFPYPQSMANCVTCHEGKLDMVLTDDNFKLSTCKSCHPVTGDSEYPAAAPALADLLGAYSIHDSINLYSATEVNCAACHSVAAGFAPLFSDLHSGYDSLIYDADNNFKKYSEGITVTVNSATLIDNVVTLNGMVETDSIYNAADVSMDYAYVSLYGYDTKDFYNYVSGTTAADGAYITEVNNNKVYWTAEADLSPYVGDIDSGKLKTVSLQFRPKFKNGDGETVALNAPSKRFDVTDMETVVAEPAIADPAKCNACHDALAVTFHSPDRGGNIEVCKTCHNPMRGSSHLETQSRSLDSYVHAIHSMQYFDTNGVDFTDPVEKAHYEEHVSMVYPYFTTMACESCHYEGTYDVPDVSKSLPGILSGTYEGIDRNIGVVPSVVTDAATRACGACHRADAINADDAAGLTAFYQHTESLGIVIPEEGGEGASASDILSNLMDQLFSTFQ